MTQLVVGATLARPPGPKYTAELGFAELTFPTSRPRPSTLAKWRSTLPSGFRVALVAPSSTRVSALGPYRIDESMTEALSWLREAQEATEAETIVVPSGTELTTSKRDRERFGAWLQALHPAGRVVWAPRGIWTAELAGPAARAFGVVCAYDPLEDDPPLERTDFAYCRLQAVGARQRFSDGVLFDLIDSLLSAEAELAVVALESPRSFQEARRLRAIASGESS